MAVVVDPDFLFFAVENVLADVVVRLDGKGFPFFVERNLVVVDHDFQVVAGDPFLHDDFPEGVDGLPGIEDVIDEEDLVSAAKEFGRIRPSVHHDA